MRKCYPSANALRVSRSALLTVLVLITAALQGVMGQVESYLFTQTSGTYTALSSPTVWQSGATISTNAVSAAVNIGFTFNFNGTGYTELRISNNGFITFGATAPTNATYNPLSAATGYAGAIAGYGLNLVVSPVAGAAPEIAYLSSGTTPNQVFTVQYKDMGRTGIAGDRMNFQIQLHESGTIAVVYGTWAASSTTTVVGNFGVVGLRGAANTDFNARMVYATAPYNTWATSGGAGDNGATKRQTAADVSAGVNCMRYNSTYLPASGLTYTWTPVPTSFYQSLPYAQNFDSWSSSRSTGDVPASTGVINSPSAGNRSWRVSSTTAANAAWTGLTGNFGAPTAQAGAGAALFNQYNAASASVGNLDFYLNLSSAGDKQATFYVRNPGTANANDVLRASLSTDGGATFTLLASYAAPINNWTQQTLALGSSTSATCVLRFQAVSDYGSTAQNLGLDELSVEVVACGVPTTLSSSSLNYTSATINWVAPSGSPVGYEYEVRTSGAAGSGGIGLAASGTTTSAVTANITGLTGATAYTYYVRTDCGSSNYSTWASSTFTTLSCNVPTGVGSSALAITTATISWTAPAVGSPAGYEWEVRSSGAAGSGATGLAASGTTTSPTVTANVTGLTASTAYSIYVRTNCATGLNSGWTAAATFTTPCVAGTVPFFEGFESGFTHNTAVGGCWSQQTVAGAAVWIANNTLTTLNRTPRTGSWNANLRWSNDDWMFYPLQLTGGVSYTFDVYARQDGATATDSDITLSYGTTATAAGMTNTVLAASGIVDGAYQLKSGTFTPGSTGVYYIGIKGFMNGTPNWISLDDISVYETPTCAQQPTALVSSAVTATSATISWTAASPAPGSGYHYFVSTANTAPTAGTTPTGSTAAGVTSVNITTGISPQTQYYYWVRSNCDGTDFSNWAGSGTFTALCAAEAAPTVSQPFTTFTGSAPNPVCWSESSTTFSGTVSANSTNSEWLNSTGFANAGTNVGVKTNLYGTDSDDWIISQPIDLGATAGLYRLSYRMAVTTYNATGSVASLGTHSVRVVISTDGGGTWALANVLRTYTGAATYSSTGVTETIDLTTYSGVVKIAFIATTASTTPDIDFHIDDFVVEAIPSCINPSSLSSSNLNYTTATINWVAPSAGSPVGYEYEVRTSGAAGSGAIGLAASGTTTSAVTANITGLTGATAYTYYVRTDCGGTYSTWASNTFTTLSCNVPTGVGSSAVATTTATISWTAPAVGSPAGYEWEVRSSGAAGSGATGLAASGSTTSPTVTANVTGLSASTAYSIYVRTNCVVGLNSGWTTAATFTTACAAITTLPHTEAFGSYLPNTCWQEGNNGDLTAGPTTLSATAAIWSADGFLNSGTTGAARINIDATGENDWLISPEFTLPASPAYRLKYSVGATEWTATTAPITAWEADDFVEVLISTTGNTNWTVLRTYNSGNVPSHLGQIDISDLTAYAGQTFRIAFRGVEGANNGSADIDFFIDNFIIEEVPNCVEPTAPTVGSVTTTSADVSWTAPSPAPSNGYFYAVTTSATPPANGSGTADVGTGPHSVSLSANTTYYLHVQGYCGGSDYSTWVTSAVFNTLEGNTCGLSQDLALLTSPFSGTTVGYSNSFTTTSGTCLTGTGGDRVFRIDVPNNYELFIGQSVNGYDSRHRIAVGGACPGTTEINTGYVANFPTTQINGTIAGCLDDSDLTHYYYKNISGSTQTVYWVQDGNSTGQGTFTLEWQLVAPPSCLVPTAPSVSSVTSTSASVSWTAPSPAPSNGYFYAVTTSATPPANGSGTAAAGTGPHSVSLSANTTYYLHVQGFCGGTDYSTWVTSAAFTTPCTAISSFPWSENFDALGTVGTTSFPTCWFKENGGWATGNVASSSYTDPNSPSNYLFIPWSQTNSYIWTPGFELTAGQTYDFSFAHVTDGFSGWTNTTVFYNTAQTSVGATALGAAITSPVYTAYTTVSRPFMPPTTGTYYFAIRVNANSSPYSMGFDDFSLTQLVDCSGAPSAGTPPLGTNVCSGATTTLTVTGATTGSGITYQWEEWNGSAWVSAVGGSGAATASYTTPALTAGKQYRFTVLCTPSSQSASTTGINITVGTPANDACATAQAITVGAAAITGSVACAAAGSGGCGGSTSDYDVWYSFTVSTAGDYRVNLLPSASFDGVFQLYATSCVGALVTSASNSVGLTTSCIDGFTAGGPEFATYNLAVGTYYVRVYDYNSSGTAYPTTTDFTIEVVVPENPCLTASNIAACGSNVNTVIASGTGAWDDFFDCASLTFSLFGREAIYTYTPTQTSSAYSITLNSMSPNGGGNYVNIMYKASTCSATGTWDCIDELNNAGTTPTFSMTAGTTYYFLIKPELTTGYTVNWRINCPPAAPVNDLCSNATPLPCGTSALAGTTVGTVPEGAWTTCGVSVYGVWYTFQGNGFSTTISSTATFDHEMVIASGVCGSLNLMPSGCVDNSSGTENYTFNTVLGTTYYVFIGHWSSSSTVTGTFTISRTCAVSEWTGNAMNNDWATNGNWSTGTVPAAGGTAFIPTSPTGANFPIINVAAQIGTLIVRPGASISIQSGHSMTVSGVLTNNGTINVASGGSLVQTATSTLAGSGTYNVTRIGDPTFYVYDYWSSPITNASVGLLGSPVYQYQPSTGTADPADDAFDPGWVTASGTMTPGRGYAALGAGSRTFSGTVNNGQIDATVAYFSNPTPSLGGVPYNLIGNPYPSAVNVGDFLTLNSSKLATGSVYLWDDPGSANYVTGDYATLNNATYIAGGGNTPNPGPRIGSLQGFKVEVNATVNTPGNGFLRFTNAMRTATNTSVLFRQAERKLLWLSTVSAANSYNQLAVGFFEDGTDGEDWGYDAPKLNALGALSFFSYMDGSPYGIQVYGELEPERVVPLGLNSQSQTMVTIALDSTENITEDVILEDRHMGIFHDLRQSSYVFQSASTLYEDRFFLHFAPQMVTSLGESSESDATIYMHDGRLFLSTSEMFKGAVRMVDISGRMVWQATDVTVDPSGRSFDMQHLSRGVYVVMMEGREGTFNAKVTR